MIKPRYPTTSYGLGKAEGATRKLTMDSPPSQFDQPTRLSSLGQRGATSLGGLKSGTGIDSSPGALGGIPLARQGTGLMGGDGLTGGSRPTGQAGSIPLSNQGVPPPMGNDSTIGPPGGIRPTGRWATTQEAGVTDTQPPPALPNGAAQRQGSPNTYSDWRRRFFFNQYESMGMPSRWQQGGQPFNFQPTPQVLFNNDALPVDYSAPAATLHPYGSAQPATANQDQGDGLPVGQDQPLFYHNEFSDTANSQTMAPVSGGLGNHGLSVAGPPPTAPAPLPDPIRGGGTPQAPAGVGFGPQATSGSMAQTGSSSSALTAEGSNAPDQGRIGITPEGNVAVRTEPTGTPLQPGEIAINSGPDERQVWRRDQVVQRILDRFGPQLGATDAARRQAAEDLADLLSTNEGSRWWINWETGSIYDQSDLLTFSDDEANLINGERDPDFQTALNETAARNARTRAGSGGQNNTSPGATPGNQAADNFLAGPVPQLDPAALAASQQANARVAATREGQMMLAAGEAGAASHADPNVVQGRQNAIGQQGAVARQAIEADQNLRAQATNFQAQMTHWQAQLGLVMQRLQYEQDDKVRAQLFDQQKQLLALGQQAQVNYAQAMAELNKPQWWQYLLGIGGSVLGAGVGSILGPVGAAVGGALGGSAVGALGLGGGGDGGYTQQYNGAAYSSTPGYGGNTRAWYQTY